LKLHVIPGTRRTRPALPDSNSAGFLIGISFVSDAELVTAENFINSRELVLLHLAFRRQPIDAVTNEVPG